jgi:outer membrane lipoprotein carrier protein
MKTRALLLAASLLPIVTMATPQASFAQQTAPADPAPQPAAPDAGPTADEIAARVQAFYDQTKTFQADFKQQYNIKMHNQKQTSEGHVTFQKPGRMSWTYNQPNGNRVVSDGRVLKVYEAQNQQMFEQPVDKSQYPAALSFLMGEGELTNSFTLRKLDSREMKFEGGWVLEGIPKDPTPAYQKVLLYVDAQTAQVRRVLILDAQDNRNRFDFDNPIVNTPVSPREFTFTPPKGTQLIHP